MLFSRRKKYYRRCQEIIDDLHRRVADNEFVSEDSCKRWYSASDYNALLHELRLMNADQDISVMTPAMEWLYHSQYFKKKSREESIDFWKNIMIVATSIAAIVSAYYAYKSVNKQIHVEIYQIPPRTSGTQMEQSKESIIPFFEIDKRLNVFKGHTPVNESAD